MKINAFIIISALGICCSPIYARNITATNDLTIEHFNHDFDIIDVATCYKQGYTGKGVSVGVVDIGYVDKNNPKIADRVSLFKLPNETIKDWAFKSWATDHPTVVAGMIAAKRDVNLATSPHGVAFDSTVVSIISDFTDEIILRQPNLRIFSTSTGTTLLSSEMMSAFFNAYNFFYYNQHRVLVAAAGNEGRLHLNSPANIAYAYSYSSQEDKVISNEIAASAINQSKFSIFIF